MLSGWHSKAQPTTANNISNKKKDSFTQDGRSLLPSKNDSDKNLASNEVTVTYIATHTNHQLSINENKFLPLPPSVKKEVEEKFSRGVSIERIMDG